jgi:hypothetical protein
LANEVVKFVQNRFFIGQGVELINENSNVKIGAKIVDITLPSGKSVPSVSDVQPSTSKQNKLSHCAAPIDPTKINYVIETYATKTSQSFRKTVTANQIQNKIKINERLVRDCILSNCVTFEQQWWRLKPETEARHKEASLSFSDIFRGDPPDFEWRYGRGEFSASKKSSKQFVKRPINAPDNKQTRQPLTRPCKTTLQPKVCYFFRYARARPLINFFFNHPFKSCVEEHECANEFEREFSFLLSLCFFVEQKYSFHA